MAARAGVIVASDSVAAGRARDVSGATAAALLAEAGFAPTEPTVVPDDANAIAAAVRAAETGGARLIVVTGGTGLGPRDVTPEALRSVARMEVPGVGEAIRAAGRARLPEADLSRALAVAVGRAFVIGLAGSPGAVRDGLAVAVPLARHGIDMLGGSGHGPDSRVAAEPAAGDPPGLVRASPITVAECERLLAGRETGAIVSFGGVVRDSDGGRRVLSLTYEAHPDAGSVLADVLEETRALPGVLGASALHRTGDLAVGDLAFAVAASAAHRDEAFAACRRVVDEVKARAPIWKHQRFADGTDEWVNCP